ncbi:MAG TPA: DUF3307 domain-containing protein [Chloroflexi bacterium]|nr:DUF3307 domain-containing protein [Chloroflexota bacterium]
MIYVIVFAHLLGDYLFQWKELAMWKARSPWGVAAHGGIVTLTTLVCIVLVAPSWWPYALLIGGIHTSIDLARSRLSAGADPRRELALYLLDQALHLGSIALIVAWGNPPALVGLTSVGRALADPRILIYAIGYLLLLNPSWVALRFIVRGVWGADAAPHLGLGEHHGAMAERILITTLVLTGQFALLPWVMIPRRLVPYRVQGMGVGVLVQPQTHWAETLLSVVLALAVGLVLRIVRG